MDRPNESKGLAAGRYTPTPLGVARAWTQPHRVYRSAPSLIGGPRLIGPDVSFYQDIDATPEGIDFEQMQQAGAVGVIIRAGQNLWSDSDFQRNWRAARETGIPRGSYWFLDPRAKPEDQADLWADGIGQDHPELDIWADYEAPDSWGGAYRGWDGLYRFMERLKINFPNYKKTIYTGFYYWVDHSPRDPGALAYFKQYRINIAAYGTDTPRTPAPWTPADLLWHQFTDNGNGPLYGVESLNIDLNYAIFEDEDAYKAYFGLDGETLPSNGEPAMNEYYEYRSNSTSSRTIREGPGKTFPKLSANGDLLAGKIGKGWNENVDHFTYTADKYEGGIQVAKAGDLWHRLFDNNGVPLIGWIAEKHMGDVLLTKTLIPSTDPQPPASENVIVTIQVPGYTTLAGQESQSVEFKPKA